MQGRSLNLIISSPTLLKLLDFTFFVALVALPKLLVDCSGTVCTASSTICLYFTPFELDNIAFRLDTLKPSSICRRCSIYLLSKKLTLACATFRSSVFRDCLFSSDTRSSTSSKELSDVNGEDRAEYISLHTVERYFHRSNYKLTCLSAQYLYVAYSKSQVE